MVEMKMKGSITPEDHEQFESHYIDDFNNDKVDLAMMISYNHKNISNQGCCLVHKYSKNNDKVIYFALDKTGTPQEKKEIIIHELHRICKEYIYNKDIETIPLENNFDRSLFNLPENGFILGSLSRIEKILPNIFNIWMEILRFGVHKETIKNR